MEESVSAAKAEQSLLFTLVEWEDILEKKTKIYSRLLTEPALAKTMEDMSFRHEKRKELLLALAIGKTPKKQNGQGRCEMNEEKEGK